ncbi:MAG: DNA translocase FtsK [Erysipelotrichaceae bacterium]|nr:DNA translocase FtsK [Erysipelotrichaceae bacterium]
MSGRKKKKKLTKSEKKLIVQLYGGIFIALGIIAIFSEHTGPLGKLMAGLSRYFFGNLYYVYYFVLILLGLYMVFKQGFPSLTQTRILGTLLVLLGIKIIMALPESREGGVVALKGFFSNSKAIFNGTAPCKGGAIGNIFYSLLSGFLTWIGALVVAAVMIAVGLILFVDVEKVKQLSGNIKELQIKNEKKKAAAKAAEKPVKKERPKMIDIDDKFVTPKTTVKEPTEEIDIKPFVKPTEFKDITLNNKAVKEEPKEKKAETAAVKPASKSAGYSNFVNYTKPRLSLLENAKNVNSTANKNNARQKGEQLIEILDQFDIPCNLQEIHIGPSVTKFEIKPDSNVKISRITSLQENIKMALAVKDVRIEAPIPGKNAVGIEIPNVERSSVRMKEMFNTIPEKLADKPLLFCLGKDLAGEPIYPQIDRMPHMLIAGSTGSGKSVCINSIIISLLLRTTPNDVKLLLIDPKKVEFTPYVDIPNLIGPVISDTNEASNALKAIVTIMENRYNEFQKAGVRNITEYNNKALKDTTLKHMFYIVVIIDELADLMLTNGKDVEASIQRITQLARASGIHLIVATQRPSTDVITGTIKTNIPSRLAFAVSSAIDSRIILDQVGAERLLGNGDCLFIPMGENRANRIQGVYVSDEEINNITEYVKSQSKPVYDDAFVVDENGGANFIGNTSADPMYDEIKKFVATTGKASTSAIQRYFGIGYNRAARVIDCLEQEGAIGPVNGSKPREVFLNPDEFK